MIIDSHVHVGGDEAGFCMNEEMVLKSMEKYQIDISIVSNGDSVEYGDDLKRIPEEMQINQEETLARVIRFCRENPGKIYNPLFIYGPSGLGKTHLALAVLNRLTQRGFSVYYNSASAIIKQFEKERFGRSTDSIEEDLSKCDLLIVDDLGAEFSTPFGEATINELVNNAILSGKPMIIISNLSVDELEARYGQRMVSRLNSFEVVEFIGEDIRQIKK